MYGCHLSTSLEEHTVTILSETWDFSTDQKILAFLILLTEPSFQSFIGHCDMSKKIFRSWFPNQFAKLQPVQRKTQRFLNSQCVDNMSNWASPLWSQNAKSARELETTWSKIPSQSHALGTTGLNLITLFCQHLKLSLGLFPKLMVSQNLSLKRPLCMEGHKGCLLSQELLCLMKFFLVNTQNRNLFPSTNYQSHTDQPSKIKARLHNPLHTQLSSFPSTATQGLSLQHQQVLRITKVNKQIGSTTLE